MSTWFQSAAPLEDGWYWRKKSEWDSYPCVLRVTKGKMIDTKCTDVYFSIYTVFENTDFQDYWFIGPIEVPE